MCIVMNARAHATRSRMRRIIRTPCRMGPSNLRTFPGPGRRGRNLLLLRFSANGLEAAGLVVRPRLRMIEIAGVEQYCRCAHRERAFTRAAQQVRSESAADVLREQAEVVDLDAAILLAIEFDVASGHSGGGENPGL